MRKLRYEVTAYPGERLGRFDSPINALLVAYMWSERWAIWADVHDLDKAVGGIIGQFRNGETTPEFEHNRPLIDVMPVRQ